MRFGCVSRSRNDASRISSVVLGITSSGVEMSCNGVIDLEMASGYHRIPHPRRVGCFSLHASTDTIQMLVGCNRLPTHSGLAVPAGHNTFNRCIKHMFYGNALRLAVPAGRKYIAINTIYTNGGLVVSACRNNAHTHTAPHHERPSHSPAHPHHPT